MMMMMLMIMKYDDGGDDYDAVDYHHHHFKGIILQSPYVYSVFHTTPFLEHHVQELF
jgi:hypothetical protein